MNVIFHELWYFKFMDNNTENNSETSDKSQSVPGDAQTGNSTAETPAPIAQADAQPIFAQAPSSTHPSLSRSKLYGKTLLRIFVAALISQLTAYAVFYIFTTNYIPVIGGLPGFGDLIALVLGFSIYIIATVLFTMLSAKLLRIRRWFLIGLVTSIILAITAIYVGFRFGLYILPAIICIESTLFMAAMVFVDHKVKDTKLAIFFMVAMVLAVYILLSAVTNQFLTFLTSYSK
jgi:hypothetical protein